MKKFVVAALLALTLCSVFAEYPDKPVTVIVPFAPGGSTVIVAWLMLPTPVWWSNPWSNPWSSRGRKAAG